VGIQIVGRKLDEERLLTIAAEVVKALRKYYGSSLL
jgi:Asp-tRNA(Asn)/Glu-tRNA(Gln) amidotransferase A subunit family amidase